METPKIVLVLLALLLAALGLALMAEPAEAQAYPTGPDGWVTQESCERFSCLYEHVRLSHYGRSGPVYRTEYGIAHDLLPDGPDGREFVTVLWPMITEDRRADPARLADWARIIECESRWDWTVKNPRSSASGGFQIINGTWRAFGGAEFASQARYAHPIEQLVVAERILWAGHGSHGPQGHAWVCPGEPGPPRK